METIIYNGPYSPRYYKKRLASKKYYENNKEKRVEYQKKYNEENKEKIMEKRKEYNIVNKEKISTKNKQYRASNKPQIADYNSQYYQLHKDELNSKKRDKTTYRRQIIYKHETLEGLKKYPNQPKAKALLHRIKTNQVDFSLVGPLSDEEIETLHTIQLPPIPSSQRRKYQGAPRQKQYRDKEILRRETDMLNNEFSRKDPNRFLPLCEILNYGNYSYDYLPQREIFKIKNYKRTSLHEKWEKEYNDYMEEVKKISNEEKKQFLKI